MKGNKNTISNKYIKIMLLTLLIIASILSVYLVTNTNNKVFNANVINQKADTREVVNIPDQDLKNFLLTYFKKPDNERKDRYNYYLKLSNPNYIKPSDENEIYKDEVEKILELRAEIINKKETAMDLIGLEKAINLTNLHLRFNKMENVEPLKGLTSLRQLDLSDNKIENIGPLKGLTSLRELDLRSNKIENIEPLRGLINLTSLYLRSNKIENIEPLKGLTNLTDLYLNDNKIENIEPLKGLTNLTDLYLGGNKIENIEPLKGLTNLTDLHLNNNKTENIEPLKGLTNLTKLSLHWNEIENIEPLKGLISLRQLDLSDNKIENIEPLKGLTSLRQLDLYAEKINVSPNTNKFNLPVLKKYNGDILDIVQASNGLLNKNEDGTYSFREKVTGVQTVNVGKGISWSDPHVDANWKDSYIYRLKIEPINIFDEKVSITKTIKDKSNTLLNNDKERKVVPVIKRNGQVIKHVNTNNVGHRTSNDELLTYTWNELLKKDYSGSDYAYEVKFYITGLPEGYSIVPNTKTADNQADFNIIYESPKVTVIKDITVNGGDKTRLPNEITVTISNDKGLQEKEVTARLKADKSGYVINENLDKTTNTGENITYTVIPKTDIPNYTKSDDAYTYVREVVNIPDQDLKNFLLKYFKKPDNERKDSNNIITLSLNDSNYIKPSDENEIYKDEMEKILRLRAENINTKETMLDLTGLEKATKLTNLHLESDKIENIDALSGLTNLTYLNLNANKIENVKPLNGLTNLPELYLYNNKIENIEPLRNLTNLTDLHLGGNKIGNIEPLKGLINLTELYLGENKIGNIEPLRGLTNLTKLTLYENKIENIEPIKVLANLNRLILFNEEIKISPNTNKFNLPVLKKYNGEILDIVQASNGLLRKNNDGTYSFTRKVTGLQIVNVGTGIDNKEPKVDTNWNTNDPIYILKIDPTNIADEKISITKTIKDKSNTLFNDKETKVLPVIKRNGQVITNTNTNNVGHRANNDELLTYTWNELPKTDDTYTDYNYEVTFDISGLPEGYSILPNTKTTDNQADFNITYVSPKITVTKDIAVNGGNKNVLPNEIDVRIENNRGLSSINKKARLNTGKTAYVVNESLDKTTTSADEITYTVVPVTDITNYTKTNESYTYVSPKVSVTKEIQVTGGNKELLPQNIKVIVKNDKGLPEKEIDATLKADKSGYVVNENLDKTNSAGENITYKVVPKTDITNYVKSDTGYTYVTPKINITVEKNWVNGETVIPETITAKLKRKVASDNAYTFVQDVTVRKENNWQLVVSNLEKTDENGNDYTYIVEEETNVDNFNPSYSGLTITNTYTVPNISKDFSVRVTGGKKDILPNEVEVIVKNNNGLAEKVVNATLNRDKTAYEVTGVNLAKTQNDGTVVTYKVVPKTDITNYEKDVVGENGYSYVIPKINFEKTINKNGGKEISLIVKLKKNGVVVTPEKSVIINSGETARFTDLDKTDFDGNDNTYSVEVVPNGTLEEGYSINTKPNGDVEVLYTSPKTSVTKDINVNRWR